jgi:hypothetical protein
VRGKVGKGGLRKDPKKDARQVSMLRALSDGLLFLALAAAGGLRARAVSDTPYLDSCESSTVQNRFQLIQRPGAAGRKETSAEKLHGLSAASAPVRTTYRAARAQLLGNTPKLSI